jgi:small subunit ribosomal protein S23
MWLMDNKGMKRNEAYDVARREFYRLRQEEQIEKRIAVEEARHVGGYFAMTRMDVGMQLEGREFENWKKWAKKEMELQQARQNEVVDSYQGAAEGDGEGADDVVDIEDVLPKETQPGARFAAAAR